MTIVIKVINKKPRDKKSQNRFKNQVKPKIRSGKSQRQNTNISKTVLYFGNYLYKINQLIL